jgi:hypothetical protein
MVPTAVSSTITTSIPTFRLSGFLAGNISVPICQRLKMRPLDFSRLEQSQTPACYLHAANLPVSYPHVLFRHPQMAPFQRSTAKSDFMIARISNLSTPGHVAMSNPATHTVEDTFSWTSKYIHWDIAQPGYQDWRDGLLPTNGDIHEESEKSNRTEAR